MMDREYYTKLYLERYGYDDEDDYLAKISFKVMNMPSGHNWEEIDDLRSMYCKIQRQCSLCLQKITLLSPYSGYLHWLSVSIFERADDITIPCSRAIMKRALL